MHLSEVKKKKMSTLDSYFTAIWDELKGKHGIHERSELKSFQHQKKTPRDRIKQEGGETL